MMAAGPAASDRTEERVPENGTNGEARRAGPEGKARPPGSVAEPAPFRLLLIRHGSTELNEAGRYQGTLDPPLSSLGVRQAEALAERVRAAAAEPRTVWTSDALRARSTAERVFPGREVTVDPRLRELDFGQLEGNTHEENLARHGDAYRRWIETPGEVSPPGGESLSSLVERVGAWLDELPAEGTHTGVAHLGTIAACLHLLLALPWKVAFRKAPDTGTAVRVHRGEAGTALLPGVGGEEASPGEG